MIVLYGIIYLAIGVVVSRIAKHVVSDPVDYRRPDAAAVVLCWPVVTVVWVLAKLGGGEG